MRPSSVSCDVLVVGAGPAGSRTARDLARRGHEVTLADENPGSRKKVICTGIVGREAFEELELPMLQTVDEIRLARFFSPAGVEVTYRPERPMARVVDRTLFDAALAEEAREAGARLLRGHAARGVEVDGAGVTVGFEVDPAADGGGERPGVGERLPGGEDATAGSERRLRARALVVATGYQRWLHEPAGLGTPEAYVHGVHADLPMEELDGAELYFGNDVAPGFFAWAVPFGPGTARLGVLAEQGADRLFRRFLLRPEIRDRLGLDPEADGGRERVEAALQARAIVQGPVTPCHADRVLAVGEAAGQVKTTTAGGIYYGMLGARAAAGVLDEALEADRLSAPDLAAYREAWHDLIGDEIRAGLELQRAVRGLEDPEIDRLFSALRDGLSATLWAAVRFDWHRDGLKVLFRHPVLRGKIREALSDLVSPGDDAPEAASASSAPASVSAASEAGSTSLPEAG